MAKSSDDYLSPFWFFIIYWHDQVSVMKNSKQAVLIIAPVMDYLTDKLEQTFTVHKLFQVTDHAEFFAKQGQNIKGIVTRGDIGVSNEVLALLL